MSPLHETLRFYRVVRPVPRLTRLAFVGVTAASAIALATSDAAAAQVLLPVLVLQAFAVSTGFVTYARRGHFDVLLTAGVSRGMVAVVYWLLAALPGLLSWMALAFIEVVLRRRLSLCAAGTITAMASVSTLPWAATVPLTRFAGAIGWLLIVVIVAGLAPGASMHNQVWIRAAGEASWFGVAAFVVFPARLAGEPAAGNEAAMVFLLLLAAGAMVSAVLWVSRTDLALETGQ